MRIFWYNKIYKIIYFSGIIFQAGCKTFFTACLKLIKLKKSTKEQGREMDNKEKNRKKKIKVILGICIALFLLLGGGLLDLYT